MRFDAALRDLLRSTTLSRGDQEVLCDFMARIIDGAPGFVAVGYPMLFSQFNADDDEAFGMLTGVRTMFEREMRGNGTE